MIMYYSLTQAEDINKYISYDSVSEHTMSINVEQFKKNHRQIKLGNMSQIFGLIFLLPCLRNIG